MRARGPLLCLATLLAGSSSSKPLDESSIVAAVSSVALPLRTVELDADGADLSFACPWAQSAAVVSLGEPGHGAHQPLAFRNRFFAYLVEHCGFTAIAIETSFTESRAVHDFISGGPGDAAALVRTHLSWGFGDYQENVQLVEWLRAYNQHRPDRRAVQFYGIDLSGADNDAGFPNAVVALSAVVDYLQQSAPHASKSLRARLMPLMMRWAGDGYAKAAQSNDPDLTRAQRLLRQFMRAHRAALVQATSRSQYDWAVHGLYVAEQLRRLLRLKTNDSDGKGLAPDGYKQVNVRDAAMAATVLWIREQERGGRLLVFAHNAHVMNARTRGGVWSAFAHPPVMMGQHLRAAMQNSLLIAGVSAGHNKAGLPAERAMGDSVEDVFEQLHEPLLWLDVRQLERDPRASSWVAQHRLLRANFDSALDINLDRAFDAMIYINTVSPAKRNMP